MHISSLILNGPILSKYPVSIRPWYKMSKYSNAAEQMQSNNCESSRTEWIFGHWRRRQKSRIWQNIATTSTAEELCLTNLSPSQGFWRSTDVRTWNIIIILNKRFTENITGMSEFQPVIRAYWNWFYTVTIINWAHMGKYFIIVFRQLIFRKFLNPVKFKMHFLKFEYFLYCTMEVRKHESDSKVKYPYFSDYTKMLFVKLSRIQRRCHIWKQSQLLCYPIKTWNQGSRDIPTIFQADDILD